MMNFQTSKLPSSWFTQTVVCVQHIFNEQAGKLEGVNVMSGKEVKSRQMGNTRVLERFEGEEDRIAALKKWFGIHLLDHEAAGIKGMVSELK